MLIIIQFLSKGVQGIWDCPTPHCGCPGDHAGLKTLRNQELFGAKVLALLSLAKMLLCTPTEASIQAAITDWQAPAHSQQSGMAHPLKRRPLSLKGKNYIINQNWFILGTFPLIGCIWINFRPKYQHPACFRRDWKEICREGNKKHAHLSASEMCCLNFLKKAFFTSFKVILHIILSAVR